MASEKKHSSDNLTKIMIKNKSDTYIQTKKIRCDWTDMRNSLFHYRTLKFYIR